MIYLAGALFFNVMVSAILKLFPRFTVDPLQAIVVNYATCVATGWIYTHQLPFVSALPGDTWLPWALLLGAAFIGIFNLMAFCTKVDGMATTVMASKLSLVIPVIFSMIVFGERSSIMKIAGTVMAFPAVYLNTRMPGNSAAGKKFGWAALLFLLSGGLDTLVNYVQASFLHTPAARAGCTVTTFATASLIGLAVCGWQVIRKKTTLAWKNIAAGMALGIPNFFSIYFLVLGLHSHILQSSATIPIFNISILVASALVAMLLFRERAGKWQLAGLALAIIAILMIAYGDMPGK